MQDFIDLTKEESPPASFIDLTADSPMPEKGRARDVQVDLTGDMVEETEDVEVTRITTKAVGVKYYRGQVLQGQFVRVVREPSNSYDYNALRVV
jgi:hypothetical protein